jgi:hypothetical protein
MLICGLGWTFTKLNYDEDHDGKLYIERVDPLEMYSDPAAMMPGLRERTYNFREYRVPIDAAKAEWGDKIQSSAQDDLNRSIGIILPGDRYDDPGAETNPSDAEIRKNTVPIICYECVERRPLYRAAFGGQVHQMESNDFDEVKDALDEAEIPYVKQFKLVYYRGYFNGDTLLEVRSRPARKASPTTPSPASVTATSTCGTASRAS